MAEITINQLPTAIGAHACQQISFNVPNECVIEQSATDQVLTIPGGITDRITIGTILDINGVTFEIVTNGTAEIGSNQIGQVADIVPLIAINIRNNFAFRDCTVTTPPTGPLTNLVITCPCSMQLTASITNLSPQGISTSFETNSVGDQLITKDCHAVIVRVIDKDDNCHNEFRVPIIGVTNCEGCEITSVRATKDISEYLKATVSTPPPDCSTGAVFHETILDRVTLQFAEIVGSDSRNSADANTVTVFNSAIQDMTEYSQIRNSFIKSLTNNQDDYPVCRCACVKAYIALDVDGTHLVSVVTQFPDPETGTINTQVIPSGTHNGVGVLEIDLSPSLFGGELCDTQTIQWSIQSVTNGEIYVYLVPRFALIDAKNTFMYLNNFGTFSTFCTSEIISSTVNEINETIKKCKPCDPNQVYHGSQVLSSDTFRQFTINIDTCNLPEGYYADFLCSTEIYWCRDGELYWIEKIGGGYTDFANRRNQTIPFTFRVASVDKLIQC